MRRHQRQAPIQLGLLLLMYDIWQAGVNNIPIVTLGAIIGQSALYMGLIDVPWEKHEVCISSYTILKNQEWKRLFLSAVEHADDMHLYFNMASLIYKGRQLEAQYGSVNFLPLLGVMVMLSSGLYVVIGSWMADLTDDLQYAQACAIGFSGVIFALKVLVSYERQGLRERVFGIMMPGKYAAWVELILIHYLVPNASFMGHLAGILAGVLYCYTFVGSIIDCTIRSITGNQINHRTYGFQEFYYRDL